jgi:FkbM family methyltransferase
MFDLKHIFKKYFRDPSRNKKGVFNYFGQQVFFPRDSIIFKRAMSEGGVYERENLNLIQMFLKPGTTMLDIGANIGMIAAPILWNERSINVVSIEASQNSLEYLHKTRTASSFKDRWTIVGKAVSDKPGEVDFFLSDSTNGAFDSLRNTERVKIAGVVKVDCTTIDTIWNQIGKPEISFIKSDIEGADLLALKGGQNCLRSCRPVMLIEWNQENIKPFSLHNADLIDFLEETSYELFCLPELRRITTLVELNVLCKTRFIENYLLIPAEKKD